MQKEGDNNAYIWGYLETIMERKHLRAYLGLFRDVLNSANEGYIKSYIGTI
jgi:hypothetical protein